MGAYLRPSDLDEALRTLAAGPLIPLAGGTDFYPARVGRPLADNVLDITALSGLGEIADAGDHWRIGALVTWSELADADLPPLFDGLKAAARAIGGVQVQNAGTLAGNLCNASPAADGMPNLLALEATVALRSVRGAREVPVAAFVTGNRRTVREPDELVTAIRVPKPAAPARAVFLKLGTRRYLVISIVMVAGVIEAEADGRVGRARIAVGACSEVPQRLPALERALIGRPLDPTLAEAVTAAQLAPLAPIDDVRGTAAYRRDAARTLVRRALAALGGGA